MHKQRISVLILSIVSGVGAFMPWFSTTLFGVKIEVDGIDVDGQYSVIAYGLAGIFCLFGEIEHPMVPATRSLCQLCAGIGSAIGVLNVFDLHNKITSFDLIGPGLWITALGGLAVFFVANDTTSNPNISGS
jgi:hypothetical protein